MKRWLLRAGLLLLLCGNWEASASAQQAPASPALQPVVHEMRQPTSTDGAVSTEESAPRRPVRDCLNRWGLACWTTHDNPGCGSCLAEWTFFFGSCRQFFGEPCLPERQNTYPWLGGGRGAPCNCRP
jgi:hypothetical protein